MIDRAKSLIASGSALFGSSFAERVWLTDLADLLQAVAGLVLVIAGILAPSRKAQIRAEAEKLAEEIDRSKRSRRRGKILSVPGAATNQPNQTP